MAHAAKEYSPAAGSHAEGILAGRIPACEWVKKACQRQVDDLARRNFAYCFDKKKAALEWHPCYFQSARRMKVIWIQRPSGFTAQAASGSPSFLSDGGETRIVARGRTELVSPSVISAHVSDHVSNSLDNKLRLIALDEVSTLFSESKFPTA